LSEAKELNGEILHFVQNDRLAPSETTMLCWIFKSKWYLPYPACRGKRMQPHTRSIALATLVFVAGLIVPPAVASAADFTSFRLTSALGQRTLTEQQGTLAPEAVKSPTKAFLYSAVVPGSGQLYVGAKRGYLLIAAEVGLLAAYFLTHSDAEDLRDQYRDHVRENVAFDGPTKFDDWDPIEDFEHATLFDNWRNVYTDDNGEPLERVGEWYWKDRAAFKDETRTVHDSPQRQVALGLREDSNDKFQLARTFLGVVILNHVVSAIDARIATKSYNKKLASQAAHPEPLKVDLQTTFTDHDVQSRVVLRKQF
jgi:hypothetical protein